MERITFSLSLSTALGVGQIQGRGSDITDEPETSVNGNTTNEAQGITGLTVDLFRYWQRDEIEQEIEECRETGWTARCVECIHETSTTDTFQDLGVAADFVDTVTGIAACVVASVYGQAWVCGLTLPAAGASAEDFWDSTFGGHDYAQDLCYGLPDQASHDDDEEGCVWKGPIEQGIPSSWPEDTPERTKREYAMAECRQRFGSGDDSGRELRDARYEEAQEGEASGKVFCQYCPPNVA